MASLSARQRAELKMALITEHLGLSWAELARELQFSVDDINRIRVENPNSLLEQSAALLNLWASHEGKRAKMESLHSALRNIERNDIVSMLEGSDLNSQTLNRGKRRQGERDHSLSPAVNGFASVHEEMRSPTSLRYTMPSPLQADHFWNDVASLEAIAAVGPPGPEPLLELSDVAPHPAWPSGHRPPLVVAEDSSLDCSRTEDPYPAEGPPPVTDDSLNADAINGLIEIFNQELEDRALVTEGGRAALPACPLSVENGASVATGQPKPSTGQTGSGTARGEAVEDLQGTTSSQASSLMVRGQSRRLPEGGPALDEAWKLRKEWAEKPGSARLRVTQEKLVQPVQDTARLESLSRSLPEEPLWPSAQGLAALALGSDPRSSWITLEEEEMVGSSEELDEELGERESGSDDEEIVATRVTRRRLIVKGEEAKNIPGESVTEEQFTDEDGNLVTKKVVRKVVRRVTPAEGKAETVEILHQDASGSENQADSSAKFGVFVRDSTSTTLGERGSALYSEWIHGRMGAQIVKRISSRANPSEQ
ncbi:ankyrin-1-like isoform X1 [Stegostoma tigrinum]|uniref:ankyrin-1-like isoform X1 n=1 Tax=Stegostoma tigrinum TaxID=3053191 RepID=UPI0028701350|nr:ankyrin-1-like isoform X1 [Stegostoma tigrinum]